jgi:hypothetical protein
MNIDSLLKNINSALAMHGYHDKQNLELTSDSQEDEVFRTWVRTVVGADGREMKIIFREHEGVPPQYKYTISVLDAETEKPIGRGNGGATWQEAIDNYHWQDFGTL